jgi:thioredoxin reductase (NADPH)
VAPDEAYPSLTSSQLTRLRALAEPVEVGVGEVLYAAGDVDHDFVVIESGEVEVVRAATPDSPRQVVARFGPGQFLGELNMLTGQAVFLTPRVAVAGRVRRVPHERFRRFMSEDPELSDIVLRSYMARREVLRTGEGARSLEMLGSRMSAAALALRNWAARQQLAHVWVDVDTPEGEALLGSLGAAVEDLPVVVTPTAVLRQASAGVLADHLGLAYRPAPGRLFDLVVVGGGPAGLAAAMYGASEGLDTVLVDAVAVGGQAAASSRIENYLGFPSGLAGADLTSRAEVQAQKFGARISTPCEARSLRTGDGHLAVMLHDGAEMATHAVIVATGARYRTLDLERWSDFEGAGIYYAATELEARACAGSEVAVVGGANSAGQAALFLARRFAQVRLVVRGADLLKDMSRYLVDRILADRRIEVRTGTEVVALGGGASIEEITLADRAAARAIVPCHGLFCFIGAEPATAWLDGVALDEDGFVLTGHHLAHHRLDGAFDLLGRRPLPFETGIPGVFAAGDVRHGSMKRVAAAVGEGASAVHSVHQAIGT